MKKLIGILLLLTMTLPIFASCNKTGKGDETTPEPKPIENLTIAEDGGDIYKIVRSDKCYDIIKDSAKELQKRIKTNCEVQLDLAIDWQPGVETVDNDDPEILIGATNRKQSITALAKLSEGEYTVRVMGKKVVILGYTDYLTTLALKYFMGKYVNADNKNLVLSAQLSDNKKSAESAIGDTGASLRIMTLNVACCKEADRMASETEVVLRYNPDILCLQECNSAQYDGFLVNLKEYKNSMSTHASGDPKNYTPILYKSSEFTLLTSGVEWLRSRYTGTNTKSLSWAVLKDADGTVFGVLNMHGAVWDDRGTLPAGVSSSDEAVAMWRLDNFAQMLEKRDTLKAEYGDIPFMFTGDFNSNCDSPQYKKMISDGQKDAEFSATVSRVTGIKTTHAIGVAPVSGKSIDHIFGSAKVSFYLHNICRNGNDLKASDHVAVYADAAFVK